MMDKTMHKLLADLAGVDISPPHDHFDETLFMSKPPERRDVACVLENSRRGWGALGAIQEQCTAEICLDDAAQRATQLRSSKVAFGFFDTPEAQSRFWLAAAAGCALVVVDEPGHAPECAIHVGHAGDGVDSIVGSVVAGVVRGKWRDAGEAIRRIAFTYHTTAVVALDLGERAGAYNRRRFRDFSVRVPSVTDAYMWGPERELVCALLSNLKVDGAVLEIGVGSGGTLAVLGEFAPIGCEVFGIDNFCFGGDLQRASVQASVAGLRSKVTILDGPSGGFTWAKPLAFLHIDGDHSEEGARADLVNYAGHVVPGGVLAFDDYGTRIDQEPVGRVADEFIASGGWEPITMGPKLAFWRRLG